MNADEAPRRPGAAARIRANAIAPQMMPNTAWCRQHVMGSQSAAPDKASAPRSAPGESTVRPLGRGRTPCDLPHLGGRPELSTPAWSRAPER